MLLFATLLACPKAIEPVDIPEVQVDVPVVETPEVPEVEEALPPALAGRLLSPECGERAYPRVIELSPSGSYNLTDLVSPCPPGGMCAWSGVVTASGTYTLNGMGVTFTETKAENADMGAARPVDLRVSQTGQLMEGSCLYSNEAGPVGVVPAQP